MNRKTLSFFNRSAIFFLFILVFLFLKPDFTLCQKTDHHTVTVVVQPITILQINVGTVNMNITGAGFAAGQDQMTVTNQSTTLLWGTNSSLMKITVKTNLVAQKFIMKVLAVNPTTGIAASEVTLSTVNTDLILNIGRSAGSSMLQYTGVALASQGAGTDLHSMTFTIQSQ